VVKEYRRDTSPSGDTNTLVSVWNVKSTTIGPFRLGQKAFCRRIKSLAVARIDTVPPKRLKGYRMVKDKSRSFPDQKDDIQRTALYCCQLLFVDRVLPSEARA